jgi:SNF2 family DNA or RNA helicase
MATCSYNQNNYTAEITNFKSSELYDRLNIIYRFNEILKTDDKMIIPWNLFLRKLADVEVVESLTGEAIAYTNRAKSLIQHAIENRRMYENEAPNPNVTKASLQGVLKKKGFIRELKDPYQIDNVLGLSKRNSGATFSVPGAGKTTEALAFFALKAKVDDCLLVVAPINAFSAWNDEIKECFGDKELSFTPINTTKPMQVKKLLNGGDRFYIVNYHKLDRIKTLLAQFMLQRDVFLFLDESHYIKTYGSIRTSAALSLAHLPKSKLIMTGTPLPNALEDLIPQFNFIYPEINSNVDDIVEKIKKVYVRTPRNLLDIPDGIFKPIVIPLGDSMRRLYRVFRQDVISSLDYQTAVEIKKIKQSVMLILQLISNPRLLLDKVSNIPGFPVELLQEVGSPKIDYACERARYYSAKNQKVILWTTFRKNIEIIAYRLKDINCKIIMGGVSSDERAYAIEQFNNSPDCNVIVINPAAGSEGISLHHNCHHAIYIDRTFNAVHWLQSQDRIRRIGQSFNPEYEILVHKDTIDFRISDRLLQKTKLMEKVLNDYTINVEQQPVQYVDDEDASYDNEFDIDSNDLEFVMQSFRDGLN